MWKYAEEEPKKEPGRLRKWYNSGKEKVKGAYNTAKEVGSKVYNSYMSALKGDPTREKYNLNRINELKNILNDKTLSKDEREMLKSTLKDFRKDYWKRFGKKWGTRVGTGLAVGAPLAYGGKKLYDKITGD